MKRIILAVLAVAAALTLSASARPGLAWKLLDPSAPASVTRQIRLQLVDAGGQPVHHAVTGLSVRIDMSPDKMADMTAPAKASADPHGLVTIETNLYAPGRWAVIISANAGSQTVKGNLVVTATQKTAQATPPARRILYYRNAMGLPDTSPVPKKDAMGMDYVPVYADEVSRVHGAIHLTPAKIQRAGVQTTEVRRASLSNTVRATGTVAADESRQAVLSARFTGFVEKLYVSQTGDVVRAGQPLMQVWVESPELLVKEADYIGSLQSGAPAHAAIAANLLRQYGVAQSEVSAMAKSGVPTRSITFVAPASGTVMEKPVVQGMHFATGDTLFKTTDLSRVWVLADVSERDLASVRVGQEATIGFRDDPSASFKGKVLFVYPELDPATRTVKVRIAVDNRQSRLRIGQYADVRIDAPTVATATLVIPASAVVDDGARQVAFVAKPGGMFEPRTLKLGARTGDNVEVLSGLNDGEQVVTAGNFLIDSESNLQTALQTFGNGK